MAGRVAGRPQALILGGLDAAPALLGVVPAAAVRFADVLRPRETPPI